MLNALGHKLLEVKISLSGRKLADSIQSSG